MKAFLKVILGLLLGVFGVVIILLAGAAVFLRESVFSDEGRILAEELNEEVEVRIGGYGGSTIIADSREDAAYALGYVHARERLFSMDFQRRFAAGELSELVGRSTLRIDKENRRFLFRERARRDLLKLPSDHRSVLESYAAGVNKGIENLNTRPWEYLALRSQVSEWLPEDSILVGYALYLHLQKNLIWRERSRGLMKRHLPSDVYQFFVFNGSSWDSALDASQSALLPLPPEASFTYLDREKKSSFSSVLEPSLFGESFGNLTAGSNSFVISGARARGDSAILTTDVHLGYGVPNVWFRAEVDYKVKEDRSRVRGFTVPGLPLFLIGSNGTLAWGLTNSRIDSLDIVEVRKVEGREDVYQFADGEERFEKRTESIRIKGAEPFELEFQTTRWGPVYAESTGSAFAVRWTALEEPGIDLAFLDLEKKKTLEEAYAWAPSARMPTMNLLLGDSSGNIGWTWVGPAVARSNYDGEAVIDSFEIDPLWRLLEEHEYPKQTNPPSGILWSANNRMLGGDLYNRICGVDTVTPIRARTIEEKLRTLPSRASEKDLLEITQSIDVSFYSRWAELLVAAYERLEEEGGTLASEAARIVRGWDGAASYESVAFRLIKDFRSAVAKGVLHRALAPCFDQEERFFFRCFRIEEPLWAILEKRPSYLLDARFDNWEDELAHYAKNQFEKYEKVYGEGFDLSKVVWGDKNYFHGRHPLSVASPLLGKIVDLESVPLSGDEFAPNVVSPGFGSTLRLSIAPGEERFALYNMPGGQSGHPFSQYYRKGHLEWVAGESIPFTEQPVDRKFELTP